MKGKTAVKIIGIVATLAGFGATMASGWVNERKTEEMIDEKVNEAITKKLKENEDEES